ncbi:MAG: hypothetical protein PWP54_1445 [Thermosipho sp. (in: thermotogales)]|jgi:predicted ABC-type ATPase|nr:hypothetical protein [Thermosipho sp. (in: thermotogales)]
MKISPQSIFDFSDVVDIIQKTPFDKIVDNIKTMFNIIELDLQEGVDWEKALSSVAIDKKVKDDEKEGINIVYFVHLLDSSEVVIEKVEEYVIYDEAGQIKMEQEKLLKVYRIERVYKK